MGIEPFTVACPGCPDCHPCERCGGSGLRPCTCRPGMDGGGVYHDHDCPAYLKEPCPRCHGSGVEPTPSDTEARAEPETKARCIECWAAFDFRPTDTEWVCTNCGGEIVARDDERYPGDPQEQRWMIKRQPVTEARVRHSGDRIIGWEQAVVGPETEWVEVTPLETAQREHQRRVEAERELARLQRAHKANAESLTELVCHRIPTLEKRAEEAEAKLDRVLGTKNGGHDKRCEGDNCRCEARHLDRKFWRDRLTESERETYEARVETAEAEARYEKLLAESQAEKVNADETVSELEAKLATRDPGVDPAPPTPPNDQEQG